MQDGKFKETQSKQIVTMHRDVNAQQFKLFTAGVCLPKSFCTNDLKNLHDTPHR